MDLADDDEETPTSRSSSSLPDDPRLREAIGEETRHLRLRLPLFACLLSCSRAIGCILDDLYIYVHLVFFRLAEQMPTADAETVTSESTAVIQQDSTMYVHLISSFSFLLLSRCSHAVYGLLILFVNLQIMILYALGIANS